FASAAFQLESTFGNRFGLRRDQFHKRRRTRLPADLSRGSHAPFQIVPRHMQLPGGPINPFLPGHLNSSRPKLSGYPGFPAAMVSPFFETSSCFFQADNRGLATCHGLPPRRGHRRQNDLNSYLAVISCRLAGNSRCCGSCFRISNDLSASLRTSASSALYSCQKEAAARCFTGP